jgi:hypothetical protein
MRVWFVAVGQACDLTNWGITNFVGQVGDLTYSGE